MKLFRGLSLIIAVLIFLGCFSGCAIGEVKQTNESLTVAYYGTDYGATSDILNMAIARYMKAYPDVELIIEREPFASTSEGAETYFTQLAAEVMSGKGPDLFWIRPGYMDVYKMMKAGAFADLAPFVAEDPDFSGDAYNTAVLNGCYYGEQLCVMPLQYTLPGLLGWKRLLDENSFDYERCTDFLSIWEELARYTGQYNGDPSKPRPLNIPLKLDEFPNMTGISWINVEEKSIDLTDSRWPAIFEEYRLIYGTSPENPAFNGVTATIMNGEFLLEAYQGGGTYERLITDARRISSEEVPCFIPLYDVDGGIQVRIAESVGVRRTSPNQQNAYNFIRILLDPELQYMQYDNFAPDDVPLSNQALRESLDANRKKLEGKWILVDGLNENNVGELSHEFTDSFIQATQKVTGSYFIGNARNQFFDSMLPYIEGKTTYEEAIKETEDKLKIYISE